MITQHGNKIYGYASVFGIVDKHNDIISAGAFKKSIAYFEKGRKIALLWQHKFDNPIGVINLLVEDEYGLYVEATISNSTQQGREAYELIKSGVINGLSVGYQLVDYHYKENVKYRHITDLDLIEISLVTFPANNYAVITNCKNLLVDSYSKFKAICEKAIKILQPAVS